MAAGNAETIIEMDRLATGCAGKKLHLWNPCDGSWDGRGRRHTPTPGNYGYGVILRPDPRTTPSLI